MSSGLDWERFGVITGGDEVCILPPPTLSEKGVGIPTMSISRYFSVPYFGLACDHGKIRFFALKSKKEKVLDGGQNGFSGVPAWRLIIM